MDKVKYIKAIIKKVKCSSEKKKEIEKQLLSDISIAVESGEKLEDIIKNMGTVDEMAEEFNSNLSDQEVKKYRFQKRLKIVSFFAILLLCLIAYIGWRIPLTPEFGTSGLFEEEIVKERVEEIVLLINDNEYETLMEMSIKEMEYVLNDKTMTEMKKTIHNDWGEFEKFENTYLLEGKQRGQNFAIIEITVRYENVSVTYLITLDKNLKLAGLYMR